MEMIGRVSLKNGMLLNQIEHSACFMLETYQVMKRKVYEGVGKPEPDSQDEKIIVAAVVCQTMIAAGANAHAFYDEDGNMSGFSIDNVNFFLETNKDWFLA